MWPLDVDIQGLGVFGDQVVLIHARDRDVEVLGLECFAFWPHDLDVKGAFGNLGVYLNSSISRYFHYLHFWDLT